MSSLPSDQLAAYRLWCSVKKEFMELARKKPCDKCLNNRMSNVSLPASCAQYGTCCVVKGGYATNENYQVLDTKLFRRQGSARVRLNANDWASVVDLQHLVSSVQCKRGSRGPVLVTVGRYWNLCSSVLFSSFFISAGTHDVSFCGL